MPIAFDAGSSVLGTIGASTISVVHTLANNAKIALAIVGWADNVDAQGDVAVTLGASSMTVVSSANQAGTRMLSLAVMKNPPTGAQTVQATLPSTILNQTRYHLHVLSYTGTSNYQSTAVSTGGATSTNFSLTMTSTDGGWGIAGLIDVNGGALTTGAGTVERTNVGNFTRTGDEASSGSLTINWTGSSQAYAMAGLVLIPSPVTAGPQVYWMD